MTTRSVTKIVVNVVAPSIALGGWFAIRCRWLSGSSYAVACIATAVFAAVSYANDIYLTASPKEDFPRATFYKYLLLAILAFLAIGAEIAWLTY
jgi:hypothetical protein